MSRKNHVLCDNLTKVYKDAKHTKALDSINFSISTNGIFALIGKNGAGKTTLVRILATELEPTGGHAYINGIDVVKDARKLRETIAIVPQEARAIPWLTPKQTISSYLLWRGFTYGEARRRAVDSLAELGLENYGDQLNRTLSGGTKRKLMVATVLASDAQTIFLDEPTTGLDPISRREFWKVLRDVGKEHFTFLTTHYLEEAEQLADVIGILDRGKMLSVDTLDKLRATSKYQYIVKVQRDASHLAGNREINVLLTSNHGEIINENESSFEALMGEEEVLSVSKELIEKKVKFSMNPISLDDIFFYLVSRSTKEKEGN